MIFRNAKKEDLDQLVKLFLEYNKTLESYIPKRVHFFKDKKKTYEKIVKQSILKNINNKQIKFLVVEENKKILGSISGWIIKMNNPPFKDKPKVGYLGYLIVDKKFHKKGIATKLNSELKKWFISKKCDFIRLEVSKNNPAIKLYEKWGFECDHIKMVQKLKVPK